MDDVLDVEYMSHVSQNFELGKRGRSCNLASEKDPGRSWSRDLLKSSRSFI